MITSLRECLGVPEMFAQIIAGMTEEEKIENDKRVHEWELQQKAGIIRHNFYTCGMNQHYLERVGFDKYQILKESREQELAQTVYKNYALQIVEKLRNNEYFNLVLCGTYGIGKTFISLCIAKDLCRQRKYREVKFEKLTASGEIVTESEQVEIFKRPVYRTSDILCSEFYGTKSFNSRISKQKLIDSYLSYDLMIIDEIGRADIKDEDKIIFDVLDARHNEGLSNILISNLDFESFKKKIGGAVTSRILQYGFVPAEQILENLPNMREKRLIKQVC